MNDPHFIINDDDDSNPYPIEVRRLLSKTLETALSDLNIKKARVNKKARKWFSEWKDGLPNYISFKDCCEYLMLTESHRKKIVNFLLPP